MCWFPWIETARLGVLQVVTEEILWVVLMQHIIRSMQNILHPIIAHHWFNHDVDRSSLSAIISRGITYGQVFTFWNLMFICRVNVAALSLQHVFLWCCVVNKLEELNRCVELFSVVIFVLQWYCEKYNAANDLAPTVQNLVTTCSRIQSI